MKAVIVNVNLCIPCPKAKTVNQARLFACEYELPSEYVIDSFEIIKVINISKTEAKLYMGGMK